MLGASLAGPFPARVLVESFDGVTVVDRDLLPDRPVPREGVPPGWQPHGLHPRGREILEEFFPWLTGEMVAHGATPGDGQADVSWVDDGHGMAGGVIGLPGVVSGRPLLEDRVRARVRALRASRSARRPRCQT